MARPSGNWTQIEVVDTGDDDDTSKLKLDLTTDTLEDQEKDIKQEKKNNNDVLENNQESKDSRPNRNRQESQNAKELEDGSEEREDKEERKTRQESARVDSDNDDDNESERGNRPSRAQKRIKQLLTRDRQKDQVIQELQRRLHATSRVAQEQEIKGVKAQRENYTRLVEAKEAELEAALNNNDSKAVAKATKELSDAQMRANALLAYEEEREANYTNTEEDTQNTQGPQNNSDVPQATLDWVERNPWFRTDGKKHMLARMVAKEVQDESKYTPDDDEFWDEVDERLHSFNVGKPQKKAEEKQTESREQPGRRKSPVGSRGGDEDAGGLDADFGAQFKRNGNRISATPTQSDTEMAERLGVDINSYMKEKFKYGNQGYKGYVNIDVPQ